MLQLKRNILCVALTSAMTLGATAANAQSTPDDAEATELDAVKVTGIRVGIEKSLDTKQSATSIVEAISAEDIGKLPDASIADSIARLPGLTAQRERGRATQIHIRGLSGDFAGTTLNGREQANTSDNRGVEFDQYPSELMSQVVVYKTPDARLVGQGLSGTVDMRTARPLDYPERVISLNARYEQNEVEDITESGIRYSFSYIDQFLDNKLGLAFGYAHIDSPQPSYQNESWGYADAPDGNKVFGGGKIYLLDDNNKRDGLMTTLQYRPDDFYETSLDLFYSEFEKTEIKSGVEFGTLWGQGILEPGYTVNGSGTITQSDWTSVKPVLRADSNPINDRLSSVGWNNKFHINDYWTLSTDLSFSNVTRDFSFLETYVGLTGDGTTDLGVALVPGNYNNFTFGTDLNDPNNLQLIDAGNWGQDGYLKNFTIKDRISAGRIDMTRRFDEGFVESISFGANETIRKKEKSSLEYKLCLQEDPASPGNCVVGATAPFPGSATDFSYGGVDGLATFDAEALLSDGTYQLVQKNHKDIANKNWSVREKVDTFYLQASLNTDLGDSVTLTGNAGVQWVSVDQSSVGINTIEGSDVGGTGTSGDNYSDFLPNLNLVFGFPNEYYLRLGAAREMQRPRMDDMRASVDVSIPTTALCHDITLTEPVWCGEGGNPKLKPWLANAYDLSAEKYFTTQSGNKGFVGVAYFYKDLVNYIYTDVIPYDYSGYALPPPAAGQLIYPAGTEGYLKGKFNGEGGSLRGYELSFSVPLDIVWGGLNGFGLQGSYSVTDTTIHPNGPGTSERLPGWSKYVSSLTAYYERGGFSIRFSQRTRSNFRGETRGYGADLGFEDFQAEKVQDAQINYNFQSGALEGLSLYLQVSNIGDEPFRSADSADSESRPIKYYSYGRTTLLGIGYKF
ncbi:TonB-dependent receptor [Pseudoxanthomonas kalamensis]|uniref:TonB-dependent receptor n=1 Tax=Pseudoxanthomonas kalamensis TaxID=289483 RepID=UPI00139087BA|nr:TonB-dependent receptor [Pseudoxanthomonas kalamensis]